MYSSISTWTNLATPDVWQILQIRLQNCQKVSTHIYEVKISCFFFFFFCQIQYHKDSSISHTFLPEIFIPNRGVAYLQDHLEKVPKFP